MSMRNYSNHGYTVKASDLEKLLPKDQVPSYQAFLEEGDWENASLFLETYLPTQYPRPDLFVMDDEFESEDLERGEMYAVWDSDQLFVQTETPGMQALKTDGFEPKLSQWVTWG